MEETEDAKTQEAETKDTRFLDAVGRWHWRSSTQSDAEWEAHKQFIRDNQHLPIMELNELKNHKSGQKLFNFLLL